MNHPCRSVPEGKKPLNLLMASALLHLAENPQLREPKGLLLHSPASLALEDSPLSPFGSLRMGIFVTPLGPLESVGNGGHEELMIFYGFHLVRCSTDSTKRIFFPCRAS